MKTEYLNQAAIKRLAKTKERRVGSDFLGVLDAYVKAKVSAACDVHNGSKKTIDASVAGVVGLGA